MGPAELTAWATVVIAAAIGGAGFTTCLLVWHGIREMRRSSEERAQDRKVFVEEERRRHEEVMAELKAQNRRIDAQSRALEELIRRTAPAAPTA